MFLAASREHFTIDTPFDPTLDLASYRYPSLDLLDEYGEEGTKVQKEELEANKNRIVQTLGNYAIRLRKSGRPSGLQ
jgi:DNA segregation ATPase FtsK/SpoIIIE, S-DNA-T family